MKKCPRCNEVYYDHNLNFCLNDGETLQFSNDSQPTLIVDTKSFPPANQQIKQGVNPIFAYLTVGLLCLLIGGGVAAFIFIFIKSNKEESALQTQNSQTNTSNLNTNAVPIIPSNIAVTPTTQSVPKTPRTLPKPIDSNRYIGNVNNVDTIFDLVWNENKKSVSGSFYYSSNPSEVFTVLGTNIPEGNADLTIYKSGKKIGSMNLKKDKLTKPAICWQGYYSVEQKFVRFCRPNP